jgi:hypothetical protein
VAVADDDESAVREPSWQSELDYVVRWRRDELIRAGYDPGSALRVATRPDVDLHVAVDLLRHGCALETALRIVL